MRTADEQQANQRDRGAVVLFVALLLPVLLLMTSFAIDLGLQRSSRRTMQARADIVALDMARLADGRTEQQILGDLGYGAYLAGTAGRNVVDASKLVVAYGTWTEASGFIETLPAAIPTAVRVTSSEATDYVFRPGKGSATRSAIGLASKEPLAGFMIGSRLASVNTSESALLNPLLSALLGTSISLNALDYDNLVGAQVSLGELAVQLGVGSATELLGTTVALRDFYIAQANVLTLRGDTAAATVLQAIAIKVPPGLHVPIGSLVDVEVGSEEAAAQAGLDVFGLLTTSLFVANGTHAVSVPVLNLPIPGVTNIAVTLSVTERPKWRFGREGIQLTTAQVILTVTPTVTLAIPGINIASTAIPIRVAVGGARGTLTDIDCASTPERIRVALESQAVSTTVGIDLRVLGLLNLTVLRVHGDIDLTTTSNPAAKWFAYPNEFLPPVGTGTMHPVPPPDLGLGSALSTTKLQSLTVDVLGILPLPLGGILAPVVALLNPVLGAVDNLLIQPLTHLLGIQLGGGDLGALDQECYPGTPILVG